MPSQKSDRYQLMDGDEDFFVETEASQIADDVADRVKWQHLDREFRDLRALLGNSELTSAAGAIDWLNELVQVGKWIESSTMQQRSDHHLFMDLYQHSRQQLKENLEYFERNERALLRDLRQTVIQKYVSLARARAQIFTPRQLADAFVHEWPWMPEWKIKGRVASGRDTLKRHRTTMTGLFAPSSWWWEEARRNIENGATTVAIDGVCTVPSKLPSHARLVIIARRCPAQPHAYPTSIHADPVHIWSDAWPEQIRDTETGPRHMTGHKFGKVFLPKSS